MPKFMQKVETSDIGKILDVSKENDPKLLNGLNKISKQQKAVLLAFIAPYAGRKITPTKIIRAQMGLSEEFGMETVIDEIKNETNVSKLVLLLNSPGGLIQSSYKVARALRNNFEEIIVFVPHIAASGGTLVALTGNEIVMGMMSQLTPLDPQSEDEKGKLISALSVIQAFQNVTEFFSDKTVDDAPYTFRALADKFDAIEIDEAISVMKLMEDYIREILEGCNYSTDVCKNIAKSLVGGFREHGEVINIDKAKEMGIKVVGDTKYPNEWNKLRGWLGKYLLQSADKHIIRYVIAEELRKKNKVKRNEKTRKG